MYRESCIQIPSLLLTNSDEGEMVHEFPRQYLIAKSTQEQQSILKLSLDPAVRNHEERRKGRGLLFIAVTKVSSLRSARF